MIELRGDEALAVFDSTHQAVRAANEFQATCAEEAIPRIPVLATLVGGQVVHDGAGVFGQ